MIKRGQIYFIKSNRKERDLYKDLYERLGGELLGK